MDEEAISSSHTSFYRRRLADQRATNDPLYRSEKRHDKVAVLCCCFVKVLVLGSWLCRCITYSSTMPTSCNNNMDGKDKLRYLYLRRTEGLIIILLLGFSIIQFTRLTDVLLENVSPMHPWLKRLPVMRLVCNATKYNYVLRTWTSTTTCTISSNLRMHIPRS
jgi:hypothetical protein